MMKRTALISILFAGSLALLGLAGCSKAPQGPSQVLLHTTAGDIRIQLDDRTPRHRDNFLRLVREGFYDSLLFHRVIADFMIQSGDPDSRRAPAGMQLGAGGANYTLPAEIVYPALAHTRGALAAARLSDAENPAKRSSPSQFYIVCGRQFSDDGLRRMEERTGLLVPDSLRRLYRDIGGAPHLDGQYTVFGYVVEGIEVVDAIQRAATDPFDRPLEDIRILGAEVVSQPAKVRL